MAPKSPFEAVTVNTQALNVPALVFTFVPRELMLLSVASLLMSLLLSQETNHTHAGVVRSRARPFDLRSLNVA